MERLWTAAELKKADEETMRMGLSSPVLMERAALAVMDVLEKEKLDLSGAVIVCGTGNNGGDGIAVARLIAERGFRPLVVAAGDPSRYSPERKLQEDILRQYDVDFCTAAEDISWNGKTLIVDALFGIGLSRPVREEYEGLIRSMNGAGLPVVSVDIPSGVHTDSGAVLGCAVKADHTVSFTSCKTGMLLFPGRNHAGKVHVRRIGIRMPDEEKRPYMQRILEEDLKLLPDRDEAGNKGTFGKVLIIAGSRDICGAAILSGKACLRAGAGMVRIYTEKANRIPVAASFPEALLDTYTDGEWDPEVLDRSLAWADTILIGPGIGTGRTAWQILHHVLTQAHQPLVLDADALNLLKGDTDPLRSYPGSCIVTPHVMEMSRLSGLSRDEIKADPAAAARDMAKSAGITVVLKDAVTVIASPGGDICIHAETNSALATAGSGDVLAGITAAVLCRKPDDAFLAASLSVCLHGYSGRRAAGRLSKASVTAGDLIDHLALTSLTTGAILYETE